jgi:SAM-dependent methyltransferase
MTSDAQKQTAEAFGYQWHRRDGFEGASVRARMRVWLLERYGDVTKAPWFSGRILDAGCGAGHSALELFGEALNRVDYLGVDISSAVEVAEQRFKEHGIKGKFMRGDITDLPVPKQHFDMIFSEGVLHHTDSTERAIKAVASYLKPGGRFMFYVYRKKAPIREFVDDYIREQLQGLSPEAAWEAMRPLTKLGIALGQLDVDIDVPEAVPLLGIPAGKMNLQRFFYWNICKAFYRDDYDFEAMNLENFDWYAPKNAFRQTPEQVRQWCTEAKLKVEREFLDEAGITIIAIQQ